jgi:hypothetical protein
LGHARAGINRGRWQRRAPRAMLGGTTPPGVRPMIARLACLLLLLGACSQTATPMRDTRIDRGTALPPPDLAAPPGR